MIWILRSSEWKSDFKRLATVGRSLSFAVDVGTLFAVDVHCQVIREEFAIGIVQRALLTGHPPLMQEHRYCAALCNRASFITLVTATFCGVLFAMVKT